MTAPDDPPGLPTRRVAVIAVHGVADQQPGTTSRALVDLLVASPPKGVGYAAVGVEEIAIAVPPLAPLHGAPPPRANATPLGEERPTRKAFRQSLHSDLWRAGWDATAPPDDAARGPVPPAAPGVDRGVVRTNYLLAKHRDNGAQREAYDTTRIGVTREHEGVRERIDVYEMYWAASRASRGRCRASSPSSSR